MDGIPIWEAGHEFLSWEPRLAEATARSPRVVSFGLVLPQLAGLSTPEGVRHVAERWGLEHLAGLARRYRTQHGVPGEPHLVDLAKRLESQTGFLDFAAAEEFVPVEMPSDYEMTVIFEEFASTNGVGIVEWLGIRSFSGREPLDPSNQLAGGLLGGFLRLMRESAETRARYEPGGLSDLVRRFYETLEVPRGIRTVYDTSFGEERWVPTYRDLAERAVIELDHLLSAAPRLSRCRLCGRVFVVRGKRPEAHCRQYLWLAWPPRRFVERCLPPSPDERERTRKRLHQRYRRALAAHGGDGRHPDVRDALDRYRRFVRSAPSSPRGRRPVPRPGFVTKRDD